MRRTTHVIAMNANEMRGVAITIAIIIVFNYDIEI